jgi:hypothetical protein
VFLMKNVHEDDAVVFQSRWALSYLRGPLTMPQIQQLTRGVAAAPSAAAVAPVAAPAQSGAKPVLPPDVAEYYLRPRTAAPQVTYRPSVFGVSKLHFVDAKSKVDAWVPYTHVAPAADEAGSAIWEQASQYGDIKADLERQAQPGALFAALPAAATNMKNLAAWKAALEDHLYQNVTLDLFACPGLKLVSQPGETEGDFMTRVGQSLREKRDAEADKLRAKYAPKLQTLEDRLRRAQERVEREKAQYGQQKMQTAISVGATLLGAFLGRKAVSAGTVGRAATAMKSAGRVGKEKDDIDRADESAGVLQERLTALQQEFEQETASLEGQFAPTSVAVEKTQVRPRKSDISVGAVGIVWIPWHTGADGMAEALY